MISEDRTRVRADAVFFSKPKYSGPKELDFDATEVCSFAKRVLEYLEEEDEYWKKALKEASEARIK